MAHDPSRRAVLLGAAGLAWPACARASETLAGAIASPLRRPANLARDRYRHPAVVLAFFGMRADQSVLEIEPGGGYWTEILAPYLQAHGTYRVAIPLPTGTKAWTKFLAKLQANPTAYGDVIVTGLAAPLAPPGSVDLVLSFRNLHDWMADGTTEAKLAAIYVALKPGGVFGIEDHRGIPTEPQDPRAKNGYVREDYARGLIEQAGFRFTAESQIGDNPRDTKNYPKGVWTLPPVLAMGQVSRTEYLAIGESDRWTMKFVKP